MANGERESAKGRQLGDISESVRARLESLGRGDSSLTGELRDIYDDLVEYHAAIEQRQTQMRGALANLVDDMSKTSQTLNETGTRLDAILGAAEGVAFIIVNSADDLIIEFSKGAERMFGHDRADVMGQPFAILCADQEGEVCGLDLHTRTRKLMLRKSGESFPALYSTYPLQDRSGETGATLAIVLDNTKREMAERLFRESHERYQALALAAPISIITFDANGTVNFVNEWHMQKLDNGRMPHEYYIGKKINELPGIVHAGVDSIVMGVLDGNPISLEDVHVPAFSARDEGWFNIRLSPLVQGGTQTGGILILEDVTRRKRTEQDLKMLIDSSPIPLLKVELTDEGGIIRELNPEARRMLGADALNKHVDDFIIPVAGDQSVLDAMRGQRCEIRTTDGIRQAIRATHKPSGQFEVQAVMDVTVLIKAKEAAEDASRAKSDFIANISHEIRTPLNVLLGMLQLFKEEDLGEEIAEMVDHATGAANSLLALLNDILDFSVVEARALTLDEQEFNLEEIIELIAIPYQAEATSKGIKLTYGVDPEMPGKLWGDARRLRQVIFHVTGNAVKFTDKGGVLLEALWHPSDTQEERGVIDIVVSDTGIGMTEEQMTHIFEPFRQADGSRRRRHGGTGIGLTLVYEFVTAMGGTITVDSKPGRGTQFRFTVEVGTNRIPPSSLR